MKSLLYIIGQPGAGKSTLVAALTAGLEPVVETQPFAHTIWGSVVELGCRRDAFSGTDALGMSVQPLALAYLAETPETLVLGEGDRLGNDSFLTQAAALGWDVEVLRLTVSQHVAEHRRATRAAALGTAPQNPAWLKGRASKVRNVAYLWAARARCIDVDGDQRPESVLEIVRGIHNPVIQALLYDRPE